MCATQRATLCGGYKWVLFDPLLHSVSLIMGACGCALLWFPCVKWMPTKLIGFLIDTNIDSARKTISPGETPTLAGVNSSEKLNRLGCYCSPAKSVSRSHFDVTCLKLTAGLHFLSGCHSSSHCVEQQHAAKFAAQCLMIQTMQMGGILARQGANITFLLKLGISCRKHFL